MRLLLKTWLPILFSVNASLMYQVVLKCHLGQSHVECLLVEVEILWPQPRPIEIWTCSDTAQETVLKIKYGVFRSSQVELKLNKLLIFIYSFSLTLHIQYVSNFTAFTWWKEVGLLLSFQEHYNELAFSSTLLSLFKLIYLSCKVVFLKINHKGKTIF